MSSKSPKISHSSDRKSCWSIFFRNPLLLKIVVWLGGLCLIGHAGAAWANVKPVVASFPPDSLEIFQFAPLSSIDPDRSPIQLIPNPPTAKPDRRPSPPRSPVATGKIFRPQHTDLLTADNYIVGVNGQADLPKIARASNDISVPPPRQMTIPDRPQEAVRMTKSRIEPIYASKQTVLDRSVPETSIQSKLNPQQSIDDRRSRSEEVLQHPALTSPAERVDRSPANLPKSNAPSRKSSAGLKSNIVPPMKPRSIAGKSKSPSQFKLPEILALDPVLPIAKTADRLVVETSPQLCTQPIDVSAVNQLLQITPSKAPILSEKPGIHPQLTFSQPIPIAFNDLGSIDRVSEDSEETATKWQFERLAMISNLQITDPNFTQNPQAPPDRPKHKIDLAPNTQMTIGVSAMEAKDFTDTIDPLFDTNNDESMISRFGTRAGIYYLVAGSGVGIRHQFSSNLEGSVGVLFRSDDSLQNNKKGSSPGNNKQSSNKLDSSNNSNDGGSIGGAVQANSYGTIAQLTYTPNHSVKVGLTYVYGHNVYPEIGSDSANRTDGGNSALGLQTFVRLNSNLALGGRIGFNQNSNIEFNKNIFTWAVTAAIPDLGGKGNLAGVIIGQEPRVTAASDLNVIDTGTAMHVEGFYQIKFSDDFSITPAIIYLTGPNIDNVAPNAASLIGAIGLSYRF
jgi:Carbohydrate-selective porin, OprB family